MRSFAIAAVAAISNAHQVHEFFAESNVICNLCQEAVEHVANDRQQDVADMFALYPKLEQIINAASGEFEIDLSQPETTCQNLKLCNNESVPQLILAERPIDFDSHIEYVNNHPEATWTAAPTSRFEGASRKELRQMMGTVVDPDWTLNLHAKTGESNVALPTWNDKPMYRSATKTAFRRRVSHGSL